MSGHFSEFPEKLFSLNTQNIDSLTVAYAIHLETSFNFCFCSLFLRNFYRTSLQTQLIYLDQFLYGYSLT